MSLPSTFSFSSPGDAARAAELRRVKALATLVLAALTGKSTAAFGNSNAMKHRAAAAHSEA